MARTLGYVAVVIAGVCWTCGQGTVSASGGAGGGRGAAVVHNTSDAGRSCPVKLLPAALSHQPG